MLVVDIKVFVEVAAVVVLVNIEVVSPALIVADGDSDDLISLVPTFSVAGMPVFDAWLLVPSSMVDDSTSEISVVLVVTKTDVAAFCSDVILFSAVWLVIRVVAEVVPLAIVAADAGTGSLEVSPGVVWVVVAACSFVAGKYVVPRMVVAGISAVFLTVEELSTLPSVVSTPSSMVVVAKVVVTICPLV